MDISINDVLIGIDDNIPDPSPIISQKGTPMLTRGNVSVIQGKEKNGKTFLSVILIASMLGNTDFSIDCNVTEGHILYIDTEQSKSDTKNLIRTIRSMVSENQFERMRVINLREKTVELRRQYLDLAIRTFNPVFVLLDGAVDIIYDFNDPRSKETVGDLMRWSSVNNNNICSVLHTGKTNGSLRGHFGAEMLNKSETVFNVKKTGDVFQVTPAVTRKKAFHPFSFKITDGIPQSTEYTVLTKKSSTGQINDILEAIFNGGDMMKKQSVLRAYIEKTGKADRTAQRHLSLAKEAGFLIDKGENYKLKL